MNWGGFALAIGALTSLFSGVMGAKAGREEAKAHERQGQIAQQEANIKAAQAEAANRQKRKRTAMAFVKSGVKLDFSPLDLLNAQLTEDSAQEESFRRQGRHQLAFAKDKARAARSKGRLGLISGLGGGGYYGAQSYDAFTT